jgi:hypothetical protein
MKTTLRWAAMALVLASPGLRSAEDSSATKASEAGASDVQAQIDGLQRQIDSMKAAQPAAPGAPGADKGTGLTFNLNADLRYDEEQYSKITLAIAKPGSGLQYVGAPVENGASNGYAGMYIRRVEAEVSGKVTDWSLWHVQMDLASLTFEDLGVELKDLPLLPYVDTGSWNFSMKVGQFRQPFGLVQQTAFSDRAFPWGAMMFGAPNPFQASYAAGNGGDGMTLVGQYVMGIHLTQQHDWDFLGYKAQFAIANDSGIKNGNNGDQPAGGYTIGGATLIPASPLNGALGAVKVSADQAQTTDTNPSEIGRLGLDLKFIPDVALSVGGSAVHDSAYSQSFDTSSRNENWYDVAGLDASLTVKHVPWKVWGEYVGSNYMNANTGLIQHAEGWYVTNSLRPFALFMAQPPAIDFNVRYESYNANTDAAANLPYWAVSSVQAVTYGIKWRYAGKNYTSANYTVYAMNGDFGAAAGSELFSIQQQVNF